MAYQSLYRTWRPQTFSEMVGQEYIVKALKNQADQKRVAHAYLFCGSRGTGKTSAARIMAMAINCEQPKQGDPCLTCESCKSLSGETTLDVFEMDAASNSRVEEIREMLSRTDYPPQFVKYKVYIIDEVHMLSNAAFNALLKTLEEPPEYMVFILATTEPQKLPATILSRCQRYDFGRISEEEIVKRLKMALGQGLSAQDNALQLIAASAQGSMRDAWSLMDMCLGTGDSLTEEGVRFALGAVSQDFLYDFLDALVSGDTAKALNLTDALMKGGRDVQVFLREFNAHVRAVLAVKWTGKGMSALTQDQLLRLAAQAKACRADRLLNVLEQCMLSEQESRWASSPRAVLELFALRASQPSMGDRSTTPIDSQDAVKAPPAPSHPGNQQESPAPKMPEPVNNELPMQTAPVMAPPALPIDEPPTEDHGKAESLPLIQEKPETPQAPMESLLPMEPEAPPNPSQQAVIAASPKDAWNRMIKRLEKETPGLYAMLHRGKFGGYQEQTFTLILGKEDSLIATLLNEGERTQTIVRLLSEEMGTQVRFWAGHSLPGANQGSQEGRDENLEALTAAFGRDKIIIRNQ